MRIARIITIWLASLSLLVTASCKSYWVDTTIENQTGALVRELEVDYPTASFGTNTLTPGEAMHYRFQIRGNGPVKVEYISVSGTAVHGSGLVLAEHQQGQLLIRLLPQGKFDFAFSLQPAP